LTHDAHVQTLHWVGGCPGHVSMVEQTLLPAQHEQLLVRTVPEMVDAIYRLAVRGAPAIGVAAAFGVLLGIQDQANLERDAFLSHTNAVCDELATARPTAVNLFWALNRMRARMERDAAANADVADLIAGLFEEAHGIYDSDRATCRRMGEIGAELILDGQSLLTHCNAGALATAGMGTALAPMYVAAEQGKTIHVFADETRPLLQGARITAWELMQANIDVTLITDSTAARVMQEGKVDAVFVGSDRIAANGDVCNKIGTYGVALSAQAHDIPFYVVAPLSTIDPTLADGSLIPIEERPETEITEGFGRRTAPDGVATYTPAFDVTPAGLVTGLITEVGLLEAPNAESIRDALARGAQETA
jgi:methylthioribose-1-phosphate isomerase